MESCIGNVAYDFLSFFDVEDSLRLSHLKLKESIAVAKLSSVSFWDTCREPRLDSARDSFDLSFSASNIPALEANIFAGKQLPGIPNYRPKDCHGNELALLQLQSPLLYTTQSTQHPAPNNLNLAARASPL
mmetsp:Transcript_45/g.73  ORF Transcript_45/g.73 Transcript_45/m.73 type:complete len:131 (+) Transcript_45:2166-2558(+)